MDAEEDAEARAALEGCEWLKDAISTSGFDLYETSWKQATERWEGYKNHYVIGQRSPFRFHMVKAGRDEGTNLVWGVFFGAYSTNGGGMLQGGAISSVFDVGTAQLGSQMFGPQPGGPFGITKSLKVHFKRPGPLKKVLRLDVRASDTSRVHMGLMMVAAVLSDGENTIAECSCEMVDPARRKSWRQQKTPTDTRCKL
jgi:acyl-coenzyme A thioesterase PaaI-like protein